ncbi:hypothetical protein DP116_19540 [Brasilonema bromeliae SPC951]|uniref:Uncharacterized protein n=1 Tax=Brasilonema bromeliae SPC951 TaxID=385972 RepID=A0ABX1PCC4_9CYAN|nr:hypothetical protein [Brasilonema bromeliae SPC951]
MVTYDDCINYLNEILYPPRLEGVIFYQLSVISYQLAVFVLHNLVHCSLFTVYCSLFTVYCLNCATVQLNEQVLAK